jgi:type IV pilus assembly protein PilA
MSFVDRCRQRHLGSEGGDEGFTLIELLVVLLIIGILLAIAIPTFLSVTKGANNTAAQSNLQNALTGAKTYFTDSGQTYTGIDTYSATTSSITQIGTGLSWTATGAASSGPHNISWAVSTNGSDIELAAFANGTNDCWYIVDATAPGSFDGVSSAGTYFGVVKASSATTCKATATTTPTGLSNTGYPAG